MEPGVRKGGIGPLTMGDTGLPQRSRARRGGEWRGCDRRAGRVPRRREPCHRGCSAGQHGSPRCHAPRLHDQRAATADGLLPESTAAATGRWTVPGHARRRPHPPAASTHRVRRAPRTQSIGAAWSMGVGDLERDITSISGRLFLAFSLVSSRRFSSACA
jgi:hypothetical protein